ncbi:hypothetical protein AX15_007504 [Amanita polypyramis BW_CC]|nr:hypothetical protein AX15_007504 [Amanita polypyramis BW_CC]
MVHFTLFQMRAATGPLETGTYVGCPVTMPEEFTAATKDTDGVRYGCVLTPNIQHQGVKWYVENMGNDIYRCTNKNISSSASPQATTKGPARRTNWIIKETNVKGEYYAAPADHPASFVSVKKDSGDVSNKNDIYFSTETYTRYR